MMCRKLVRQPLIPMTKIVSNELLADYKMILLPILYRYHITDEMILLPAWEYGGSLTGKGRSGYVHPTGQLDSHVVQLLADVQSHLVKDRMVCLLQVLGGFKGLIEHSKPVILMSSLWRFRPGETYSRSLIIKTK